MNSNVEIVDVDEKGNIVIPYQICEIIGIHRHDKLIIGVEVMRHWSYQNKREAYLTYNIKKWLQVPLNRH